MTKNEFDELPVGATVWFHPAYLTYMMPATVKVEGKGDDAVKGIWVNFFGDGQCFFAPSVCPETKFYPFVESRIV